MRTSNRMIATWLILIVMSVILVAGCGQMKGGADENVPPEVSFVNVHDSSASIVYDYAPVVHWKGRDADGFVEYYSYADITDSAALKNPIDFIPRIPDEAWTDTMSTQARIFLLTLSGDTTEHVFYIRCTDNRGAESAVKYRMFNRTNRPPNIPRIGITGENERNYSTTRQIGDTLFSAPEVTSTYPGIQFSWRGTDPDDKSLFQIPLQFKEVLVRAPADTIFSTDWSDDQDIILTDLETGFYTLSVWSRDDGYTESVAPARALFNVIRPTFEHNLLLVIEDPETNPAFAFPTQDSIKAFYDNLLNDITAPGFLSNVNLSLDSVDVRVFPVNSTGSDAEPNVVPMSLIHQYKLVVYVSDQFKRQEIQPSGDYVAKKLKIMRDYLSVGGRVWIQGRMVGYASISYTNADKGAPLLMRDFFGVTNIVGLSNWLGGNGAQAIAEFVGTQSGLQEFPSLAFDTTRADQNWNPLAGYAPNNYGETGVERIERGLSTAQTTQYFLSNTASQEIAITGEDSEVLDRVELGQNEFGYPPTSNSCYIQTDNPNVIEVTRVVNLTHQQAGMNNWEGEVVVRNNNVILVSYEDGQPWSNDDSLAVDYLYDPITEFHLKPCEVRYEGTQVMTFQELRFRTALSTFSYYFIDYNQTLESWRLMLDWFFDPRVHQSQFRIGG